MEHQAYPRAMRVARQAVRAGEAAKRGDPSAHAIEAPIKGHGAEAPRKSKLRPSGLGRPTLRKASWSGRVRHSREKIECAVSHCRRRRGPLERRSKAPKNKAGARRW